MAVDPEALKILHYPAPVLRRKADPVQTIDDPLRRVASRMLELMHAAPGVGLAAPQVGLSLRLFVANPSGEPNDDRVYVNPRLLEPTDELEDREEGCLSLPEVQGTIRRPRGVTIEASDLAGQTFRDSSDQLLARIWQHEYDHLDGVLILDRMPPIDRMANRKAVKALEAAARTSSTSKPGVRA